MENSLVVREVASARDALQISKSSRFNNFLIWKDGQYQIIDIEEIWKWARSKGQEEVRKRLANMALLVELKMPWRN